MRGRGRHPACLVKERLRRPLNQRVVLIGVIMLESAGNKMLMFVSALNNELGVRPQGAL